MANHVILTTPGTKETLDTINPLKGGEIEGEVRDSLCVIDIIRAHSTFKSATRTTAGTTTVVSPNGDGSLIVTDIIIGGEKQAGSSTEIRFTDGVDSVTLFLASQVDAPPNIAAAFGGKVQGWKDARIDMITGGAGDATVLIVYTKVPTGLAFAEWDSHR